MGEVSSCKQDSIYDVDWNVVWFGLEHSIWARVLNTKFGLKNEKWGIE